MTNILRKFTRTPKDQTTLFKFEKFRIIENSFVWPCWNQMFKWKLGLVACSARYQFLRNKRLKQGAQISDFILAKQFKYIARK